jgi:hypothetical protein
MPFVNPPNGGPDTFHLWVDASENVMDCTETVIA